MANKRPLYIADIEKNGTDKVLGLSFVKNPATGYNFKVLERNEKGTLVFAPILVANTPIFRNNEKYGEHNVLFLPDVITDIMTDAMSHPIRFDVEHNEREIPEIEWISSFQIDYRNKTFFNNYPLPDGSWVGMLNIVNLCLRAEIERKNINGISISGIFTYNELKLSEAIELYNKLKIK